MERLLKIMVRMCWLLRQAKWSDTGSEYELQTIQEDLEKMIEEGV